MVSQWYHQCLLDEPKADAEEMEPEAEVEPEGEVEAEAEAESEMETKPEVEDEDVVPCAVAWGQCGDRKSVV